MVNLTLMIARYGKTGMLSTDRPTRRSWKIRSRRVSRFRCYPTTGSPAEKGENVTPIIRLDRIQRMTSIHDVITQYTT